MPDTPQNPGVLRARTNISELKAAIRREQATIEDYRDRIKTGRGGFPVDGLRHGIERCEHNVRELKAAIISEKAGIRSMEGQQKINEEMARLQKGIEIPVDYADENGVIYDSSGPGEEDTVH
jgi:predicted RNase H-like nuclease (RuvC/YqgF family)